MATPPVVVGLNTGNPDRKGSGDSFFIVGLGDQRYRSFRLCARLGIGAGQWYYWTGTHLDLSAAVANPATAGASPFWKVDDGTGRGPAAAGDNRFYTQCWGLRFVDGDNAGQSAVPNVNLMLDGGLAS